MTGLAIRLFNAAQIQCDNASIEIRRRKTLALLAYLAVTQRKHSRDELAAMLWPDYDQASARANLRRNLSELNRALGDGWLHIEREWVELPATTNLSVDVVEFRRLAAQSQSCHLAAIQTAADLYAGDFLAGFTLPDAPEFELWQTQQAESLRRDCALVLERLAHGYANAADYANSITAARRWLDLDPLNEPPHRWLMQLYALSGNRSAALRQYVSCVGILRNELGVEPEPDTVELYKQILAGKFHAASGLSLSERPAAAINNLPEQPTPFIGRTRELAQIQERLSDPQCRLLTIVGPGGIGKTRLAIQAAKENGHLYRDGVCFVALTAVSSPDLLAPSILHALAPGEYGDANALFRLIDWLADKQMLLVLDNFEHLVDEAQLLLDLLHKAHNTTIIVSSRQRLSLREEYLEPLDGMAYPMLENDFNELDDCDATRLFGACMRRIRPNWQPSPDDVQTIGAICRQLEGMPLAIEHAASWTRTLPLPEVHAELARGHQILSTSLRDMPARHRSMHAVFEHSWQRLSPQQRSILRQMSVFSGGCTREAAIAVTGATLADLSALVDASWLRLRSTGRYHLHELVRQFCEEKLVSEHHTTTGEDPAYVHRRHCDYYAESLRHPAQKSTLRDDFFQHAASESGNLRAAFHWAAEFAHLPAVHSLVSPLWYLGDSQGWHASAYELFAVAAKALGNQVNRCEDGETDANEIMAGLARICRTQGAFAIHLGQMETARSVISQLEALVEKMAPGETQRFYRADVFRRLCHLESRVGDYNAMRCNGLKALAHYEDEDFVSLDAQDPRVHQADTLAAIGCANWSLGNYSEAERCWRRSLTLLENIGELRMRPQHSGQLARLLNTVGSYEQAEKLAREALQGSKALGDELWVAIAHINLGCIHRTQNDLVTARSHLLDGLQMWRKTHYHRMLESFNELGLVELAEGHISTAKTHFHETLHRIDEHKSADSLYAIAAWLGLGWTALAEENLAEAHAMFHKALATGVCTAWEKMEAIEGLAEIAARQHEPERAARLLALVEAHPFTACAQRQHAAQVLDALRNRFPQEQFTQLIHEGQSLELDAVIQDLVGDAPHLPRFSQPIPRVVNHQRRLEL